MDDCDGQENGISQSARKVQDYLRNVHQTGHQLLMRAAGLQTFFHHKRHQHLFVVLTRQEEDGNKERSDDQSRIEEGQQTGKNSFDEDRASGIWDTYVENDRKAFGRLDMTGRVDEETPWLRRTGFQRYLTGCHKSWVTLAVRLNPIQTTCC